MRLGRRALFVVGLFLAPSWGQAQDFSTRIFPDYFANAQTASMSQLALGSACVGMVSFSGVMPCNPALVSVFQGETAAVNVYLGNDYQVVSRYHDLLTSNRSAEFARQLFEDKNQLQMEGSVGLAFRAKYFAAAFIPYRVSYSSFLFNDYNPILAVHAMQERTFSGLVGGPVMENVYLGLQARFTERRFVQDVLSLFDQVGVSNQFLQVASQSVVYVEPGAAYFFEPDWQTRFSFLVTNIGFASQRYSDIPFEPNFDLAVGTTPPLELGSLDLAINYRFAGNAPLGWSRFRLATSYSLGLMGAVFGWGQENLSFGVTSSFSRLKVGIFYRNDLVYDFAGEKIFDDAVFTEFSLVF